MISQDYGRNRSNLKSSKNCVEYIAKAIRAIRSLIEVSNNSLTACTNVLSNVSTIVTHK